MKRPRAFAQFTGARSGLGVLGVLGALAAILAAGCGHGETASPAVSGTGYRFEAPKGFERIDRDAAGGLVSGRELVLDTVTGKEHPTVVISVSLHKKRSTFPFKAVNEQSAKQLEESLDDAPEDMISQPGVEIDTVTAKPTSLDGTKMILLELAGTRKSKPFAESVLLGPRGKGGYTVAVEGDPDGVRAARTAMLESWDWQ